MNWKIYSNLGYDLPKEYDKWGRLRTPDKTKIIVDVQDLSKGSHTIVQCLCDYCNTEIIDIAWKSYLKTRKNNPDRKDMCKKCKLARKKKTYGELSEEEKEIKKKQTVEKRKKTNFERYGVEFPQQLDSVKNKIRQTCLEKYKTEWACQSKEVIDKKLKTFNEKYGVDNPFQNEEIKDKIKQINLQKYGYEIPSKNEGVKNKAKHTNLQRYGVDSYTQSEDCKIKIKETNNKKYGVDNVMNVEEFKHKNMIKRSITMYKNGTAPCSKQQEFLHCLLGGKLNYPEGYYHLDIAFPEEKVYIEYDGGGHLNSIKYGHITIEEFENKERRRWYYLYNRGWRQIKLISLLDLLPKDLTIHNIINEAKEYINMGHSWIEYDIDNNLIICSQFEKEYDFGELRKIIK